MTINPDLQNVYVANSDSDIALPFLAAEEIPDMAITQTYCCFILSMSCIKVIN